MIDLHCHILSGIDDGAQTVTDSLAMAQQAVSEGIHTIVATPHHQNGKYVNERTSIIHHVKQLNDELQQHNIPLTILPGQEVRLYGDLLEDYEAGKIVTLIVVTKSTVPVGTNHHIKNKLKEILPSNIEAEVVSNPEFLREGSAVYDIFNGDRIVIGADCEKASAIIRKVNEPFGIPIYETDICSAEMIKYASNAFLATKISFINEIANVCEKVGADVEKVAVGMGLDSRVGNQFLKAGIGYGGSCFLKIQRLLRKLQKM